MLAHFTAVFAWVTAHWAELLAAATAVVAAASALVKALEVLVSLLVALFPGLVGVNGELSSIAGWLDGIAKSSLLNRLALSPKSLKVFVLLFGLSLGVDSARAAPILSSGPTLPLLEVRPGNPHPVSLAAGAGLQLSATLPQLQVAIGGKAWDLLDLNLMAFGTAVSNSSGATVGSLSIAAGLCTMSSLLCLGIGHDVMSSDGSIGGAWFGLFALSFNFALSPSAPPVGVEKGAQGLARGNTLYFGAP